MDEALQTDGELVTTPRMDIVHELKSWIDQGRMPPGAQVPAERELCAILHAKRPTVRNALKILEGEGLIRQVSPRTRVVAERPRLMANSVVVVSAMLEPRDVANQRQPGWLHTLAGAAREGVEQEGYNLVSIHPDRVTEQDLQRVLAGRPDGLLMPEINSRVEIKTRWLTSLHKAGIPVIAYGDKPELQPFDRVVSDHASGAYQLTQALIAEGRKRILMLFRATSDVYWVRARRAGYEQALREAGLQPLPLLVSGRSVMGAAPDPLAAFDSERRHMVSYLMDYLGPLAKHERIDALMVATDGDTYPAAAACRALGVEPGRDVLVVGYDGYWADSWEREFEPAIPWATIDKQNAKCGREMVTLLTQRIAGTLEQSPTVRVMAPSLIRLAQ